jgi:hypothetical protein
MGILVNVDSGPVSGGLRRGVDRSVQLDQNQVSQMKTTLASGSALRSMAIRSSTSRRASRGRRDGLLAVAVGLTPPGLRAAAVRVRRLLGHPVPNSPAGAGCEDSLDRSRPSSQVLVGGEKMRFFHRSGCPMTVDRDWPAASSSEHSEAGRAPCGMCRP